MIFENPKLNVIKFAHSFLNQLVGKSMIHLFAEGL